MYLYVWDFNIDTRVNNVWKVKVTICYKDIKAYLKNTKKGLHDWGSLEMMEAGTPDSIWW